LFGSKDVDYISPGIVFPAPTRGTYSTSLLGTV
jgi:hypothetical protein